MKSLSSGSPVYPGDARNPVAPAAGIAETCYIIKASVGRNQQQRGAYLILEVSDSLLLRDILGRKPRKRSLRVPEGIGLKVRKYLAHMSHGFAKWARAVAMEVRTVGVLR